MTELKIIDGKAYNCTEIKPSDLIIKQLQDNCEEYEKLLAEIQELEQKLEEQEKAISSIEYTAEYEVINQKDESGKELNTNENKRKIAKNKILSENEIYIESIKAKNNNLNLLKLKTNRLKFIEFQTGAYKRILEYRSRTD